MEQLKLALHKLDDGPESLLDVWVEASNGDYSAAHFAMLEPEDLTQFGEALQDFPKSIDHCVNLEVVLERGNRLRTRIASEARERSRNGVGSGTAPERTKLLLGARYIGSSGSAIEVKSNEFAQPPHLAAAHFFIECEAAALNSFGKRLCARLRELSHMREGEGIEVELNIKR